MNEMGLESPVVQEMKMVLTAVGTNNRVFSLSNLRYLVGALSNNHILYSGQQQDGVKFITLLLQHMGATPLTPKTTAPWGGRVASNPPAPVLDKLSARLPGTLAPRY